ncbi:MAG: hypothetical protein JSR66_33200 [Proteobacteria bacterium]|nr:hypothetical protein [Pseudomonadota bacterium]
MAKRVRNSKARMGSTNKLIPQQTLQAWGVVDKGGKLIPREPVLSKKALAYAKKLASNRGLAIAFLKRAGIIERPGKLHKNYR